MSTGHRSKKERNYVFHPLALSFVGFSGLGKTTLVCKLLERLASRYHVGYVKHDIHRFDFDKEGKDTHAAWTHGASQVFISDQTHFAWQRRGEPTPTLQDSLLLDCDFVFIEGHKNFPIPKIVFLDDEHKVLSLLTDDKILAYVGKENTCIDNRLQPYFCRDAVEEIEAYILGVLQESIAKVPVNGLILSGGKSRRMGTDKALLNYHGRTQVEHCHELLQSVCKTVYVSTREGQLPDSLAPALARINDRFVDFGPLGGILSAMLADTKAAWLVIACDLPFLEQSTLQELFARRNPFAMASVFCQNDGFLEPLCGIYEPKIRKRLFAHLANDLYCPQRILERMRVQKVFLPDANALRNVNEYEEFEGVITSSRAEREISVLALECYKGP